MADTSIDHRLKTALVTGASSGIGHATALALAACGLSVTAVARRVLRMADLREAGCTVRELDLMDREATVSLVEDLAPDVVVNNAGIGRMGEIGGCVPDDVDEQLRVNVAAVLDVLRVAVPPMRVRGFGHVVNVSSIAAHHAFAGMPVYAATKAAVAALTDRLRIEMAGTGVRVTEIIPGRVETEIFGQAMGDFDEARRHFFDGYESLKPQDVAAAVAYAVAAPAHVNVSRIELVPVHQVPGGISFHSTR